MRVDVVGLYVALCVCMREWVLLGGGGVELHLFCLHFIEAGQRLELLCLLSFLFLFLFFFFFS